MAATMFDANNKELYRDDQVTFWSSRTKAQMDGVILSERPLGQMVSVQIDGDPFPVNVPMNQLTKRGEAMPAATAERPSRREMRKLARSLGIDGWESLSTDALWKAIQSAKGPAAKPNGRASTRKAKTTTTTKAARSKRDVEPSDEEWEDPPRRKAKKMTTTTKRAPAKRTAKSAKAPAKKTPAKARGTSKSAPQREVADNGNPFRPGTNLFLITDELIKGGSRQRMIDRLNKKIDLHPWAKKSKELDLNFEMDKRILLAAHMLKDKHGFTVTLEGRGPGNGTIKATPPGSAPRARKAASGPATKTRRTSTKKATAKKTRRAA